MADDSNTIHEYSTIGYLQDLFAAPLIATVEADAYAAETFVEFVRRIGFVTSDPTDPGEEAQTEDWGKLRTIKFAYYQTIHESYEEDGKKKHRSIPEKIEIELPVITMIPLPALQVDTADFQFDIQILGAEQERYALDRKGALANGDLRKPLEPLETLPKIRATLTPLTSENQESRLAPNLFANLKAKIRMKQADLPGGLSSLLNITNQAIQKSSERPSIPIRRPTHDPEA